VVILASEEAPGLPAVKEQPSPRVGNGRADPGLPEEPEQPLRPRGQGTGRGPFSGALGPAFLLRSPPGRRLRSGTLRGLRLAESPEPFLFPLPASPRLALPLQ
jgi:hypothetical protein